MKKYLKEIITVFIQLLFFYILPMFAGPTDAMGMVVIIICSVLVLSLILGAVSDNNIKLLYPVVISLLFIPSVFIYYNDSALVHALWYLCVSFLGMGAGSLVRMLYMKIKKA